MRSSKALASARSNMPRTSNQFSTACCAFLIGLILGCSVILWYAPVSSTFGSSTTTPILLSVPGEVHDKEMNELRLSMTQLQADLKSSKAELKAAAESAAELKPCSSSSSEQIVMSVSSTSAETTAATATATASASATAIVTATAATATVPVLQELEKLVRNFESTIRSCLGAYCFDEPVQKTELMRVGLLGPPLSGVYALLDVLKKAGVANSSKLEFTPDSHVNERYPINFASFF